MNSFPVDAVMLLGLGSFVVWEEESGLLGTNQKSYTGNGARWLSRLGLGSRASKKKSSPHWGRGAAGRSLA